MKKLLLLFMILLIIAVKASAQEKITLELTTEMIKNIKVPDFDTKPCNWGFSVVADNEDAIKLFVRTLSNKESRRFSYGSKDGQFICSVQDNAIFTGESLYARVLYLNELASQSGAKGISAFGLMDPVR